MKITLNAQDITEALLDRVSSFGVPTNGMTVKMKRSAQGVFSAELSSGSPQDAENDDNPESTSVPQLADKSPTEDPIKASDNPESNSTGKLDFLSVMGEGNSGSS